MQVLADMIPTNQLFGIPSNSKTSSHSKYDLLFISFCLFFVSFCSPLFFSFYQGGSKVLSFHGNSIQRALHDLFPEIEFDKLRFSSHQSKFHLSFPLFSLSLSLPLHLSSSFSPLVYFIHVDLWSDTKNRRKFFENYAKDNKFDPLKADNWYLQSTFRIMSIKVPPSLSSSLHVPPSPLSLSLSLLPLYHFVNCKS